MAALKDAYPLYLANEAQTPNLDLEVTDKYTGKVATRVALADAKMIDAGIAATVVLYIRLQLVPKLNFAPLPNTVKVGVTKVVAADVY